jgi:hypothetical protein
MKTSFVAFLNKHGIACASDTDMTLYALSRQEPVALAVNSYSPIPWDTIINAYLRQGEIAKHEIFGDYARDFSNYLSTVKINPGWKNLTEDDGKIIFLGFGTDDVFPSAVDIQVHLDDEASKLICDFNTERGIDHDKETDFYTLSHFENTQPIIYGISDDVRTKLIEKQSGLIDIYKQRILDVVKGTKYEENIQKKLSEYDATTTIAKYTYNQSDNQLSRIDMALDSFNIEDLVKMAEDFVDAKVQLDHLKSGGKGELPHTKELAVITRTEGVVYIKHCLFGL